MHNSDIIVCIGSGKEFSSVKAELIAIKNEKDFLYIYNRDTKIANGVYHTSLYDINLDSLIEVFDPAQLSFVFLDDTENDYDAAYDFYKTGMFVSSAESAGFYVEYVNAEFKNNFLNVITKNKAICVMPWIGIHKRAGETNSCCLQNTFPPMEELKEYMLAGDLHDTCRLCHKLEENNGVSDRMSLSSYWSSRLNIKTIQELTEQKVVYFHIRLSNKCNAMCRICDENSSNLIDEEYYKLGLTKIKIGINNTQFISEQSIIDAERLYFAGGEPLIHNDFLKTLEFLKNKNLLDKDIVVNTNAAALPSKFIDLTKGFTDLTFTISIDAIGKKLTYTRWPIKWDKFVDNINTLYKISNGQMHFNTTLSVYNIADCYETFKWIGDNYPMAGITTTILDNPEIQQAKFFPNKDEVLQNLNKIKTLPYYNKDKNFASVIDYAETQCTETQLDPVMLAKFFEFNDLLDDSRKVLLKDHLPLLEDCRKYVK
tara:strand:+ start:1222 stop:2673 length:1452 start_codon:yes stop_codon:yes gene_type:complete